MKILYIITKSESGGAQTHIYQLSKYLINGGHNIGVMSYPGGWLEGEIKKLGGRFFPNYFFSNRLNLIKDLKAMKEIKKAVKEFRPDLISCHSTKAGFLGRLTIRNKVPTLFTAHGWGFAKGTPFFRKLVIPPEKIAAFFCKKIICVSENDRKLALNYRISSASKLITIHNGVEISKELPKKDYSYPLRIVFIGRLAPPKRPLLLIRAFNELPPDLKEKAQVFIIGEGQNGKKIEHFVKENKLEDKVKLLGGLPRNKVLELLQDSHIFVLISDWEGFPRTVLEAMSKGLVVIASKVGGIEEVCSPDCGFLVRRGDTQELKDKLSQLIKNPDLIKKMGYRAHQRIREEFSLERMFNKTSEVYRNISSFS
jgi:glycosyltransferase involved in cell wall biosynthesis